jgi:pyruvate kinase
MILRKTKIVCSIGPSSNSDSIIRKLILAGMNRARFNFSHGTYKWHKNAMDKVKRISAELSVDGVEGRTVLCTAQNACSFGSRKNVNLRGVHAGLPIMSEQGKNDIAFCVEQNMDFIAASFVSFPDEITQIRGSLDILGSSVRSIAKIENEEGVKNIDAILKRADGSMVARGDLGVQIPPETIPLVQKSIIGKCRQAGKPVITATQMLDSMIEHPRPTSAELTDVANAVFDGEDDVIYEGLV